MRRSAYPGWASWASVRSPSGRPSESTAQPLRAGAAAQELVVDRLDPGLADLVAGREPRVVGRLELVGRDLADVAEHLRAERWYG